VNDDVLPPAFELLVKAYFGQDWDMEGHNARAVLERFVANEPREDVAEARETAASILDSVPEEDDAAHFLDALGLQYDPEFEGLSHREWLRVVVEALTPLDERGAEP